MNGSARWFERFLLGLVPVLALLFIPSLGNAFLLKQSLAALGLSLAFLALALQGVVFLRWIPAWLKWTGGLYLLLACLQLILARNPGQAFQDGFLQCLFLSLFFAGFGGYFSLDFSKKLALVVSLSAVLTASLGIAQWFFPEALNFGLQALGKMKTFSTLGNPNYLACYLVLALPLLFYFYRQSPGGFQKYIFGGAFGLCLGGLALSDSRSGWLAFGFCLWLAAYFLVNKPLVRSVLWAGLAALILTAFIAGTATHTGRGRVLIWREAVEVWAQHPLLGVGLGNFNIHQLKAQAAVFSRPGWVEKYSQNAAFVFDAHNELLNQLVETGLLGCLCWMVVAGWAGWRGWKAAQGGGINRAWFIGWAGMLFYSLWNTAFFYAPLGFCFWLSAGLFAGEGKPMPRRGGSKPSPVAIGLCGLLVLFSGTWLVCQFQAGFCEHQGDLLLETGPFDKTTQKFREAIRWNPYDGYLQEKLALSLFFEGKGEEALVPLARARELYGDVGIPYLKAEILAKEKKYGEAAEIYQFIGRAFPNHVTPPFMLGQIDLRLGKREEARMELQRVLDIPESPYNLKLDREKVRKQKELAHEMLMGFESKNRNKI